ncbi:conserved membrane hypothetical protein [Verrucomicrobia bacterium]|nr:conserved membrane hypothetical protein [Verrucomicrobiota bacterium]
MNWLPIVDRELRVAARKGSTFWLRVAAAIAGLVLGGGCMLLSSFQAVGSAQMGNALFELLTWGCLVAGLSAGLFFTSDCLSEEKREGTLGLLFLTELRGYDVALGKLLATSLRGFYALLAVFPILAITYLMGGVAAAQYWKASLALVNALFFSLAAGLLISALSRDSQKALAATLLLLLALAIGGPVTDAIIAGVKKRAFTPLWSLSSPAYAFAIAGAWGRSPYWEAFALTQLLGWGMLALACGLAPRTWQERKLTGARAGRGWIYAWKYGGVRRRQRLRRKLLERRPMAWLACRERWQSLGVWTLAIVIAGAFVIGLLRHPQREIWMLCNYLGGLLVLVLYLWAASQACRFLGEARRSGFLELLLVAPISERQIVGGQGQALLRMFGLPVLVLLGVQLAIASLSQLSFQNIAAQAGTATSTVVTNQSGPVSTTIVISSQGTTNAAPARTRYQPGTNAQQLAMALAGATATVLTSAANLLALGCFGMWMGLTSRTANLATLKTLLFVQVIPWMVITFGTTMLVGMLMQHLVLNPGQPGVWFVWWPLLNAGVGAAGALAKDVGFIVWSRKKLLFSLREVATRGFNQPKFIPPPPLPAPPGIPPIIPASNY